MLLHHTMQLKQSMSKDPQASRFVQLLHLIGPFFNRENLLSIRVDKMDHIEEMSLALHLFRQILVDEYHPNHSWFMHVSAPQPLAYPKLGQLNYTCDFCGADIFQSFFQCTQCVLGKGDMIHICPGCFTEGRTCLCGEMEPIQCWPFRELLDEYNHAVRTLKDSHVQYAELHLLHLELSEA